MQLQTGLDAIRLMSLFQDFEALVGARHWERMVELVNADIRGRPFLQQYFVQQHRMAYALNHFHNEHRNGQHVSPSEHPSFYEAATLIVQFTEIAKAHPGSTHSLVRRLHGALDRPEHMRGLQFELEVATQLARQGHSMTFPDLDGTGRFDILAVRDGGQPIEFECKYITQDKGRRVTRYAAHLVHHATNNVVTDYAKQPQGGTILRVIFDGRAPISDSDIARIVTSIGVALVDPTQERHPFGRLVAIRFDVESSPFSIKWPNADQVESFLESHGIINAQHATRAFRDGGVVIITLESSRRQNVLDAVFDTAKDAAKKQLTGNRPAVLCVKFEGISPEALIDIGEESDGTPTALRVRASAFLHSSSSDRVSLLTFFADAEKLTTRGTVTTRESASYTFRNDRNHFHTAKELVGLFR